MSIFIDGAYGPVDIDPIMPFIPAPVFPVVTPVFVNPIPTVQIRRPVIVTTSSGILEGTRIVHSDVATTLQGPFGEPILLSKTDRLVYPTCHLYWC